MPQPIFSSAGTGLDITGKVNSALLKRLLHALPDDAERISRKYSRLIAERARRLAPSSRVSKAKGNESNNPHNTELRDNIKVRVLDGNRRVIAAMVPWAKYVIRGADKHTIPAGGKKSTIHRPNFQAQRLRRQLQVLERRQDKVYESMPTSSRRPTEAGVRAQARRYDRLERLDFRMREIEQELSEIASGGRDSERSLLMFPWKKGRSRWKSRFGNQPMFVGPVVWDHPGTKANNFLGKAVSHYTLPFYNELQRALGGA